MNFLLLLRTDGSSFDEGVVFDAVRSIPGLQRVDREHRIDSVLEAHVRHEGDATIIRLSEDRTTVSVSENGSAAFFAAFEIGRRLEIPIRLVDSDYVLDVALNEFESAEALRRRYEEAVGAPG